MSAAPRIPESLPRSFSAFCSDQMKDWRLLFPAEQSYFQRLFGLVARTPPEWFQPLR